MRTSSRLKGLFALLLPTSCLIGLVLFSSKGLATHAANVPITNSLRATQNLTRWSIVSSPNPGTADNFLNGVATISANDVWAVGHYTNNGSGYTETFTEHWGGTSWSVIPSQNPEPESILNGVAAVSTNDVWAVGYQQITNTALTLIEHWDGVSWSVIPSPNVTSQENILTRVAVVSTSDVWAVGYDNTGNPFENQTLIEHWDGTQWSIVPSQSPAAVNNVLMGVTAIAAGNIWAVGYQDNNGSCPYALIEHWNGL